MRRPNLNQDKTVKESKAILARVGVVENDQKKRQEAFKTTIKELTKKEEVAKGHLDFLLAKIEEYEARLGKYTNLDALAKAIVQSKNKIADLMQEHDEAVIKNKKDLVKQTADEQAVFNALQKDKNKLIATIGDLKAEAVEAQNEIQQANLKLASVIDEFQDVKKEAKELSETVEKLTNTKQKLTTFLTDKGIEKQQIINQCGEVSKKFEVLQGKMDGLTDRFNTLNDKFDEHKIALSELEDSIVEKQRIIRELDRDIAAKTKQDAKLAKDITSKEEQFINVARQRAKNEEMARKLEATAKRLGINIKMT